ncbi:MAG TPA: VanZ family protein, partial [Phycisphaerae bacterium]|nr:VanZ family protein [Phycisphaerae bacterium]
AFVVTHIPAERVPPIGLKDTSLHLLGFLALGAMGLLTLLAYRVGKGRRITLVISLAAIYAGVDEITQPLVGRADSLQDWIADLAGAILAVLLFELTVVAISARRRARAD